MNSVNVVLDEQLSTRPDAVNATDVTTISQAIIKYAKALDPQYHYNPKHRIAARPDTPNAIDIATITQVIADRAYAKVLGPPYHRNLNQCIAAALNRDPDTVLTKVLRKDYNHDVVSVRTMEVDNHRIAAALDSSKGDSTTTHYRVTAYFIFDVHYHRDGAASDTLNVVVW